MTVEEEIRFFAQTIGDAQRTLLCEPGRVDEIRAAVEAQGLGATITVRGSVGCPPGRLLLIDEPALQASMNQTMQRAARNIRMRP